MKRILSAFSFLALVLTAPAYAEMNIGFSVIAGSAETDGSETEKTVSGVTSEKNKKSVTETFVGASIFAEYETDGGFILGLDYVPMDLKLGSGKRTDATTDHGGADVAGATDTGDRKAEANIDGLITVYAHVPMGDTFYGIVGYHDADITTTETLPTSTYGDASINGYQIGIGAKSDRVRFEVAYSDFDDISLTSTDSATQKIEADADALAAKISIVF